MSNTLNEVREEWHRNMQSSVKVSETQERIANLISSVRLGDRSDVLIPYLESWLSVEREKEQSLNWFQRMVRKLVL